MIAHQFQRHLVAAGPTGRDRSTARTPQRSDPLAPARRVLAEPGTALPAGIRETAERAYRFDFSRVRVHDGLAARAASDALGASGWTWGDQVVLGSRARPDTLMHELGHVVQQSAGVDPGRLRVERDPALERDASGAGPARRLNTRGIQLQHPDDPPRLNLTEPVLGAPQPQQLPGLPGRFQFNLTAEDRQRIDAYLLQHRFGLIRLQPALDGAVLSRDEIVSRLRPLVLALVERDQLAAYLESRISGLLFDSLGIGPGRRPSVPSILVLPLRPLGGPSPIDPPVPAGPAPEQPDRHRDQGWQTVLGAGGQIAWHLSLASGRPASTPTDTTLQFQAARNYVGHPDRQSGPELQGLIQFGYNRTTGQISVLSGAQYTEVLSLLNGLLQVSGFVQVVAGVAAGGGSVAGQIQPSVGAQAVIQLGPVGLVAGVARGVTIVPGGESTQDSVFAFGLQGSF